MVAIANLKDKIAPVLIGGAACTGKDTAAAYAAHILGEKGYKAGPISTGECLRQAHWLSENDTRERFFALCRGREDDPFVAELVANSVQAEPDSIIVISGLRRKCDAEYFYEEFPYSHFIVLFSDTDTLVERIVRRNRQSDFPSGTPEEQNPEIARQILADEERVHRINGMLAYVVAKPCKAKRGYVIDTSKQKDCANLEKEVAKALASFGLT